MATRSRQIRAWISQGVSRDAREKTIGKIAAIDPDRRNFEMSASFTGLQANND